ncbi:Rpn family recombination-promoting nuclease/putative transposase [Rickettsiella endosymbiont of Dermanyssus gallinae]|uniref:Rpn family recombination-promoting nuclease/putative transposase n=1 Tax=Rickettsiella endosymbiont of Dermanyssus gallinae TaxID=2856608 RepID=UPI001C52EE82|nr:Rpn family recombination-promoting nuclease/putative transposase [Rickettsiella endosymbiont of Dermanyssus gallinae]
MTITIHQPFDKLFKISLTEKKVAISYLKARVPAEIYKRININTLELTDKSFILPKFRQIHSDIVYRCQFDNKEGYIFFLLEAESTANEELMAFRLLQYSIAAMDQHIRQGHKKLPIVLPICLYHGIESPYPHPLDVYQCFDTPDLAKQVAFMPFTLLDLTVLSDDELAKDGLAFLMEMLLKHSRTRNFLTILKQRREAIKGILKQLNKESRRFMVKYVINETQDENEPDAVEQLVQILTTDLPEDKEIIMTFAQQLKQEGFEKGVNSVTRIMQSKGFDESTIEEILKLSKEELEQEKV